MEQGGQHRGASWFRHSDERSHPHGSPRSGETFDDQGRNIADGAGDKLLCPDRIDPFEMTDQFTRCQCTGAGSQLIQGCRSGTVMIEETIDATTLISGKTARKDFPSLVLDAMANAGDQPFQGVHARQQDLVRHQPMASTLHQEARPIVPGPAQSVEPACQSEAGGRRVAKVTKSVHFADQGNMPPSLTSTPIGIKRQFFSLVELLRHDRDHLARDVGAIVRKCAQKTDRTELQGEAHTIVCATKPGDPGSVGFIEVEIPSQFVLTGHLGKASKAMTLLIAQNLRRHDSRKSRFLRGRFGQRGFKELRLAKVICEIIDFRNMFRTASGAAA